MSKALVVVESPTKARSISSYLGPDVVVESSMGHVRDLPKKELGVDVEKDFQPKYVTSPGKGNQVKKLRTALATAESLYLATDRDREGEAIAWHLTQLLKPKVPVRRMVFQEITRQAIRHAFDNPRDLDTALVESQEARRILDRLYGYEVSPVLWRKVKTGLSAGRVQSVAVRLAVERARDRIRFVRADYWNIVGAFHPVDNPDQRFEAPLAKVAGQRVATGKDFTSQGELKNPKTRKLGKEEAEGLASDLAGSPFTVTNLKKRPYKRSPSAPYRTSTLQQDASRRLGMPPARAMRAAQRLYENGHITYMRTDSVSISSDALATTRKVIRQTFGDAYLPSKPRFYQTKVKAAQEAHEAIRPAGTTWKTPQQVTAALGEGDPSRLYQMIWRQAVASQMKPAVGETVTATLEGTSSAGVGVEFQAQGRTITFAGFLRAFATGSSAGKGPGEAGQKALPPLSEGQRLSAAALTAKDHQTRPPAWYTEASLIRTLEKLGVGRPSTYASIMSTIQDRGYVWTQGRALIPSFTAFAVVSLLEQSFPKLVDYEFTAKMEGDLDRIADRQEQTKPWLQRFYFGEEGLKSLVDNSLENVDTRLSRRILIGEDTEGEEITARIGRYGPYLLWKEKTVSIPDRLPPDELDVEKALELLAEAGSAQDRKILGTDPQSGLEVLALVGRYGPYLQLGETKGSKGKPKRASLPKDTELGGVSLDDALRWLSLPRLVGADPESGEKIYARYGRYGPYVSRGKTNRNLPEIEQLFTITVAEALQILETAPARGRSPALRVLGEDPRTGKTVELRDGKYGPYVSDGVINASLGPTDTVDAVTVERASDLLETRRQKRGAPRGRGRSGRRR
ncbi:MAG: type I DNA topoisomerase [bacterium]|nr:type I DNA topoisomerase [bacterium]